MEQLRQLQAGEADKIFRLISERVDWMNRTGLHHWNDYDYTNLYPENYYEDMCRKGCVYVLEDTEQSAVCAAAVILEEDERWPDRKPAYYIHNFASSPDAPGAGKRFVQAIEKQAEDRGKRYVRLDVLEGYTILQNYYAEMGYERVGTCSDGDYHGILREKKL